MATLIYSKDNKTALRLKTPLKGYKASYFLLNSIKVQGCNTIAIIDGIDSCWMKHDLVTNYLDRDSWQAEQDDFKRYWSLHLTEKELQSLARAEEKRHGKR